MVITTQWKVRLVDHNARQNVRPLRKVIQSRFMLWEWKQGQQKSKVSNSCLSFRHSFELSMRVFNIFLKYIAISFKILWRKTSIRMLGFRANKLLIGRSRRLQSNPKVEEQRKHSETSPAFYLVFSRLDSHQALLFFPTFL